MRVQLKALNKANVQSVILKTMLQKTSKLLSLNEMEHQKVKERTEVLKEEKIQYQTASILATIVHSSENNQAGETILGIMTHCFRS